MSEKKNQAHVADGLRARAEALAQERAGQQPEDGAALSPEEIRRALHELRVHQIELEMQNEELLGAQLELEASRARYFDLYDLAPVGYCTLSEQGLILEANLTAATLLGVARGALVKQPLSRFILKEDQDIYYLQRKQLFETGEPQAYELRLVTPDGATFWAHLSATVTQATDGAPVCRVIISDITARKQAEEALQESEERFRRAVLSAPFPIMIHAEDGQVVTINTPWTRLTGYEHSDIPTIADWTRKAYGAQMDLVRADIDSLYALDGPKAEGEYAITTSSGDSRIWDFSSAPIGRLPDGRRLVISMATDVTERKRAEEALREHAAQLGLLNEIGGVVAGLLDLDQMLDRAAHLVQERFGYHHVALFTRAAGEDRLVMRARAGEFASLLPPDHSLALGQGLVGWVGQHGQTLLANDVEAEPRYINHYPDLVPTRSELSVPVRIGGDESQVVGVLDLQSSRLNAFGPNDVTTLETLADQLAVAMNNARLYQAIQRELDERLRAEAELRRLKEFNEGIVQGMAEGIVVQDAEGTLIFVNPAAAAMLGYDPEELVGQHWTRIVPPDQQPLVQAADERRVQGQIDRYEVELVCKDGARLPVLVSAAPRIRSHDGHFEGGLAVFTDLSELKRMEEQFRQAQKMEAIGRLAGGVAHDFNNLLTVIHLSARLLEKKLHPEDPLWQHVQRIQDAGRRAANLTKQLLAFSRKEIVEPKVMDLNDLLGELDEMLPRLIGEDVLLETVLAEDLWSVKIDPTQVEQVVVNLAVNARDAMPDGGRLTIETANVTLDAAYAAHHLEVQPGEYVLLAVSDTGVGMDDEVKSHIFEPFFTTKERGKGTGLGLSTVFGIVKQNGGHVGVYSEVGQGTTFKVYLPRVSEGVPAPAPPVSQPAAHGSETLLLVEDEPMLQEIVYDTLQGQGYQVLTASDGVEALQVAEAHEGPIHLLLTDVVMPRMSGKALADQLRSSRPEMQVLFTSGYTDNAIVHHGVLAVGVHFLSKPFELEALARKVRDVLDGAERPAVGGEKKEETP